MVKHIFMSLQPPHVGTYPAANNTLPLYVKLMLALCLVWSSEHLSPLSTCQPTFNLSRMLPVVEGEAGAAVRAVALWGHAWLLASRQSAHAPTQQLAMDGRSSYNTCSSASR